MARNKIENIDSWDKLVQSCPLLFNGRESFYFECSKGWMGLLTKLCLAIEDVLEGLPAGDLYIEQDVEMRHQSGRCLVIGQIKEKFGTLRFYMDGCNDDIDVLIRAAEAESAETCEKCGEPGSLRTARWFATLCDEHDRLRSKADDLDD